MLNRCCVADGSLAEPPLSLQGRLLHFYGSSILTNSATDAQNTVRTELPSAHHRAWREHTRHETMCITSRVCLSTVHMCLYLIYCMCILHCGSNTTLDQRLTLKLCCKYTFRLSELEVRFSLSTRCWWGGSWGGVYDCVDWDCVHPSISKASNNTLSLWLCVCPGPPLVPVSASLLSQLILIYGLTLFPAGWLDT